jgi:hypothetical protein
MADEWDTVTKIGSKVRPGGGSAAKEKVIRSEAQLNAARRQGADIATEKKFGGTNSVSDSIVPLEGSIAELQSSLAGLMMALEFLRKRTPH